MTPIQGFLQDSNILPKLKKFVRRGNPQWELFPDVWGNKINYWKKSGNKVKSFTKNKF